MKRKDESQDEESTKKPRPLRALGEIANTSAEDGLIQFAAMIATRKRLDEEEATKTYDSLRKEGALQQSVRHLLQSLEQRIADVNNTSEERINKLEVKKVAHILECVHAAEICRRVAFYDSAEDCLAVAVNESRRIKNEDVKKYVNTLWSVYVPPFINALPNSVLALIFENLDVKSATYCLKTCRKWRAVIFKTFHICPLLPAYIEGANDCPALLPNELLIEIFSYLDTDSLNHCQASCQRWRHVILNATALWSQYVVLKGGPRQVESRWEKICQLSGGHKKVKAMAVHKDYSYGSDGIDWKDSSLYHHFPHNTLHTLKFSSCDKAGRELIWNSIIQCTQLKELQIEVSTLRYFPGPTVGEEDIKCRLEDIHISGTTDDFYGLSKCFYFLFRTAKRVRIDYQLNVSSLHGIVTTAARTLEELHLLGGVYSGNDSSLGTVELPMLRILTGDLKYRLPFQFDTPSLTRICFDGRSFCYFDCLLVDKRKIKNISVALEYRYESSRKVATENFFSFWKSLDQCQSITIAMVILQDLLTKLQLGSLQSAGILKFLPNLRRLTITKIRHDFPHEFDGEEEARAAGELLLQFLRARNSAGLPHLESLVVDNCGFFGLAHLVQLRNFVGSISSRNDNDLCKYYHKGSDVWYLRA